MRMLYALDCRSRRLSPPFSRPALSRETQQSRVWKRWLSEEGVVESDMHPLFTEVLYVDHLRGEGHPRLRRRNDSELNSSSFEHFCLSFI
jgi:hypothetical protein